MTKKDRFVRMLTPRTVAAMFGVNVKTIRRWAAAGMLPHVLTVGGHRRYPEDQIKEMLTRQGVDGRSWS